MPAKLQKPYIKIVLCSFCFKMPYHDVNSSNAATTSNRYNENLSYDSRGNILTTIRTGNYTDAGSCLYNTIDNLTYYYSVNSNKLTSITDASATAPKPQGL